MKLLVVDDDLVLAEDVCKALRNEGYLVDHVGSADEARQYFEAAVYDLLILDWELPGISGPDFLRQLRSSTLRDIRVIMLTGRSSINDKKVGFSTGADDYLTKPFDMQELIIRIRAILSRPAQRRSHKLQARNITLYIEEHKVYRDDEKIDLFPKEFALLEFFMSHPNEIFSADVLLKKIWDTDADASLETLRVTLMRIRQKLQLTNEKPLIVTIRNVGYTLEP